MQLISTLVNRLSGVPLPKNLYFKVDSSEYRIVAINEKGVRYSYSNDQGSGNLSPNSNPDLILKGIRRIGSRTVVSGGKYILDCEFE